ncbi:rhodanese-like domain-containing protein [Salisediminibacterium beveridgei]|nr:rhodanese-like domain-containing protein [Salisediminibacterium beveridgei]
MMKRGWSVTFVSMGLSVGLLFGCSDDAEHQNEEEAADDTMEEADQLTEEEIHWNSGVAYFNRMPMTRYMLDAEDMSEITEEWLVVDLRDPSDFELQALPDAHHASWQDVAERLASLPQNEPVLWVSADGQTASMVMAMTRMAGLDSYVLAGGMENWEGGTEKGSKWLEDELTGADVVRHDSHESEVMMNRAEGVLSQGIEQSLFLLSPDELNEKLDELYVVDTRSEADYQSSHLPGAHHYPVADLGLSMGDLPDDKPLMVYCYSGQTGAQAASVLRMAGFDAYSLKGGMGSWENDDFEIE